MLEDCNDMIEDLPNTFFVTRPGKCKSKLLIRNMNKLGEMGGFTAILDRLQDKADFPSFEVVLLLIEALGNLYPIYHKMFAQSYIQKL